MYMLYIGSDPSFQKNFPKFEIWLLLLLLKLTIINTTIKKLILHSVVLDPLENAKIKSVPKTSQYYAIYTKTFKKYVQILRI